MEYNGRGVKGRYNLLKKSSMCVCLGHLRYLKRHYRKFNNVHENFDLVKVGDLGYFTPLDIEKLITVDKNR